VSCHSNPKVVAFILTNLDVAGEFIRSDVRDGQAGVKLVLDTQVLDYKTCQPVKGALLEIWCTCYLFSRFPLFHPSALSRAPSDTLS
jgi:hypothetical protein